jgi:hypothetical protein
VLKEFAMQRDTKKFTALGGTFLAQPERCSNNTLILFNLSVLATP